MDSTSSSPAKKIESGPKEPDLLMLQPKESDVWNSEPQRKSQVRPAISAPLLQDASAQYLSTLVDDRDYISELPDNILLHIMSFADIQSAIRTCVLSKRWKNVCKTLNNLTCYRVGSTQSFIKFVNWVLFNRDHSYSLLNLTIDYYGYIDIKYELLQKLLEYAFRHNVEQLTMRLWWNPIFESLPSILRSVSLKSLELNIDFDGPKLIFPKPLYMPALKSLHLSYVRFIRHENDEYVEPFSKCGVLNNLVLRHCGLENGEHVLCISNSTLSSLTTYEGEAYRIQLSTPNLTSLTLKGSVNHQLFSACNLSFLEKVNIFIYQDDQIWDGKSSIIISWLQALANVKVLTFSQRAVRVLLKDILNSSLGTHQPPCFVRLKTLRVKRQLFTDISEEEVSNVLKYLLVNSPETRVDIIRNARGREL